ncbi:MAG TPA: glycosyltransferase [Bacillus sp. (in: firmicutes)]|nr:glycosyltransferase [Bacillus sp. (in: firmicutes)]
MSKNSSSCQQFCTVAGKKYVIRVLALYNSLKRHSKKFHLWICCIDQLTYHMIKGMKLTHVKLIKVKELENKKLKKVKRAREVNEYCWTLKAPFIEYLLTKHKLPSVVYCDSDIYFFSNPTPLFKEWGKSSVFLCPQRDLDWVEEKYGLYQAGLIGFKNDKDGLKSVRWWKAQCLDWCSAQPVDGKFGDQKYLDQLPDLFSNIKISKHLGINAAPWNSIYNNNYNIKKIKKHVYIEKDPLIAFHFACLKIFSEDEFDLWSLGPLNILGVMNQDIYAPYLEELQALVKMLKKKKPGLLKLCLNTPENYAPSLDESQQSPGKADADDLPIDDNGFLSAKTPYKLTQLKRDMNQWNEFYPFCTIVSQDYLVKGIALYESLKKQCDNFHLWICCMDEVSYSVLSNMQWSNTTVYFVGEIETDRLQNAKRTRTLQEYCWTLKSQLCLYILEHFKEIDRLVYCDADIYFFSHPKPLFDEWGTYSLFMCPQRGTSQLTWKYGYYQAGLLGFKQEGNSRAILNWWKNQCIDWCFDKHDQEGNRWGDQKYLEHIPYLFENIKIIRNIGINAAPWNLVMNDLYTVHMDDHTVKLDGAELIAYHFGSMLMLNEERFDLWKLEKLNFTQETLHYIYQPYIEHLQQITALLRMQDENLPLFAKQNEQYEPQNLFHHPYK